MYTQECQNIIGHVMMAVFMLLLRRFEDDMYLTYGRYIELYYSHDLNWKKYRIWRQSVAAYFFWIPTSRSLSLCKLGILNVFEEFRLFHSDPPVSESLIVCSACVEATRSGNLAPEIAVESSNVFVSIFVRGLRAKVWWIACVFSCEESSASLSVMPKRRKT